MQQLHTQASRDLIALLSTVAGRLASVRSFEELAETVLATVEQVISVQYTGFFLLDPETEQLRMMATRGFTEAEKREAERTAADRHPGRVVRTGQLLHIPDIDADTERQSQDSGRNVRVRSRLFVPVRSGQRCVGAYGLASSAPHSFNDAHIAMLDYAANLTGAVYGSLANELKLRRQIERVSAQQAELIALSSPVIEVWERTLALPLIGTIDRERAGHIAEKLLGLIVERRTQTVILDFTGAGEVSPESAAELQRIMNAIELLGSRCLLSGVSPQLARQLATTTQLPQKVQSTATLQHALASLVLPQRPRRDPR